MSNVVKTHKTLGRRIRSSVREYFTGSKRKAAAKFKTERKKSAEAKREKINAAMAATERSKWLAEIKAAQGIGYDPTHVDAMDKGYEKGAANLMASRSHTVQGERGNFSAGKKIRTHHKRRRTQHKRRRTVRRR